MSDPSKIIEEINILILEYLESGGDPIVVSEQLKFLSDMVVNFGKFELPDLN